MWGVALLLFAAFLAGVLAGGGPTLWFAILVGLAVFGGDPSDPLGAVIATVLALAAATVLRTELRTRARR